MWDETAEMWDETATNVAARVNSPGRDFGKLNAVPPTLDSSPWPNNKVQKPLFLHWSCLISPPIHFLVHFNSASVMASPAALPRIDINDRCLLFFSREQCRHLYLCSCSFGACLIAVVVAAAWGHSLLALKTHWKLNPSLLQTMGYQCCPNVVLLQSVSERYVVHKAFGVYHQDLYFPTLYRLVWIQVIATFVFDTTHQILITHTGMTIFIWLLLPLKIGQVYWYVVTNYANPAQLAIMIWWSFVYKRPLDTCTHCITGVSSCVLDV